MREVTLTIQELGLGGGMSTAAAEWQDRIGGLGLAPDQHNLMSRVDALLARL